MDRSFLTLLAVNAALQAGELLRQGFYTPFQVESKGGLHNLVTEYDKIAEKCIISTISSHFPTHSILAEESGEQYKKNSDVLWIIDPLDGTVNFAHHIPIFCVSIGVALEQQIVSGVVYSPMLQELFVAEKGKGAYLNGKPLHVSSVSQVEKAFMSTGFPYNVEKNPLHCIDRFAQMQIKGVPIRRLGSAALDLAYVAAGRYDAFWELNLNPWDTAAGTLLIEEAGGKLSQYNGEEYNCISHKTIVATNGHLHREMIHHLNSPQFWQGS